MRQFSGKIYIEGAGRLASHLAPAFKAAGLLSGVRTRDEKKSQQFAKKLGVPIFSFEKLTENDIVFCAVPDDAMAEILYQYAPKCHAVSVSGSFDVLNLNVANTAVFYPLQTFSEDADIDFKNIPILLESKNPELLAMLHRIAGSISNRVEEISHAERQFLHVCAVFVNNFTTYISAHGKTISEQNNIDFSLLRPLIQQTFRNILSQNDLFSGLTGPARRNDTTTIQRHLSLLSGESAELYTFLTNSIERHYDQL